MLDKFKRDIDKEIGVFLKYAEKKYGLHRVSPLLYRGIKDFLERDGKRIRSVLFMISYYGYVRGKGCSRKDILRSALSLELLHDFLLAHDDVIDRSAMRRGRPALHKLYNEWLKVPEDSALGEGLSVVAGDIVYAWAIDALVSVKANSARKEKALSAFIRSTVSTGLGEFIDVVRSNKNIGKITEADVMEIYTLKTAKYTFEGPMLIAATLAGAGKVELAKISKLGITLGNAFQILDDLLDLFLSSKEIGKPVLSDLAESKKTLLVWKAYDNLKKSDKKTFKHLFVLALVEEPTIRTTSFSTGSVSISFCFMVVIRQVVL